MSEPTKTIAEDNPPMENPEVGNKKKEIYTYEAPWTIYSMAWRRRPEGRFQLALGSFIEEYANQIQIVQIAKDETTGETSCVKIGQADHPYPPTKILWAPAKYNLTGSTATDVFATSGDYLRIWNVNADYSINMKGVLNNNKHAGKLTVDLCLDCLNKLFCSIFVFRILCSTNWLRLERDRAIDDRLLFHRHHLHHLGCERHGPEDSAHCPR
jgi:hypothetical protein